MDVLVTAAGLVALAALLELLAAWRAAIGRRKVRAGRWAYPGPEFSRN